MPGQMVAGIETYAAGVAAARIVAYTRNSISTGGDQAVPFTNLLKRLVASVEGATGALILEADGEAVQWYCPEGAERLRLRCAYLVNVLQSCRTATARLNVGEIGHLAISYDGASFVVQEVSPGYYLLLEMSPRANVATAVYRLKQALPEARAAFDP